jgi:hypothetical protein
MGEAGAAQSGVNSGRNCGPWKNHLALNGTELARLLKAKIIVTQTTLSGTSSISTATSHRASEPIWLISYRLLKRRDSSKLKPVLILRVTTTLLIGLLSATITINKIGT